MYRHLIAIAAATLCAATAHAQTSVTLSGLTDVYVGSIRWPATPTAARWSIAVA